MSVLVIGMGRSGTSALTGTLAALGLSAGSPEGLLAPNDANPTGYFEQRDVVELNNEILAALGGAWDCPPQLADGWSMDPSMAPFIERASELVHSCYAEANFVLKDPRVSVLLPLWRRALLDRFSVVMIVRDPSEVAWSLYLRDGIAFATGLALWSMYNRCAIAGLDGLPVHFCSYEALTSSPRHTIEGLAEALDGWGELPHKPDMEAAVAQIQPRLRRDTWPRGRRELTEMPEELVVINKLLIGLAGSHRRFESEPLPMLWWEGPVLDERRRAHSLSGELPVLERCLHNSESRRKALETELALAVSERDDARLAQASVLDHQRALQEELDLWKGRWERLEQRLPVRAYRAMHRLRSRRTSPKRSI